MTPHRLRFLLAASLCLLVIPTYVGCSWGPQRRGKLDLGVDPIDAPLANSAAYKDTIGAATYVEGMRPMRVRGYGLVVGLGQNGAAEYPRSIYDQLVQDLYKQHKFSSSIVGVTQITPEQLIRDLDTAIVIVEAEIPPGAVKGARFDVAVRALPGTKTKSLHGGRLYTAEMQVYTATDRGTITGQTLAQAAGPLFLNPFASEGSATKVSPRTARILGGGVATQDRRISLVLTQPSHVMAKRIQERINAQFSSARRVANAVTQAKVELRVPEAFHGDEAHFLSLVRSLYLTQNPRFTAIRSRQLGAELLRPLAPHAMIACCLEGLGQAAIPVLNELYSHETDYVSFHAAVAGLRLGEYVAGDVLALHASDPHSAFRFNAIRALGAAGRGMGNAVQTLRRLLSDPDPRVRIAAYEALLQRKDHTVRSTYIAGDNFALDIIPSEETSFIYVKRSGARRIALFGPTLSCVPPLLYRTPNGSLTATAMEGESAITLLRYVPTSGSISDPILAPLDLPKFIRLLGNDAGVDLDGVATGLGMDYGTIVGMLHEFCRTDIIKAEIILEQPNTADMFGPVRLEGRPESEL